MVVVIVRDGYRRNFRIAIYRDTTPPYRDTYHEEWNSLFAYFMVGYWLILLMEMVRD